MSTVEETLSWEAQWRPRAALAAILAAILGTAGGVLFQLLWNGGPDDTDETSISLPESLAAAANGTEPADSSYLVRLTEHRGDKFGLLTLSTVLNVLAVIAALLALTYLFRATRARNPQIGRAVGWSLAGALALYPLGRLVHELGLWAAYSDGVKTAQEQRELGTEGIVAAATLVNLLGAFALTLAIVLVAMNAMRVGLLTRFMGILGVIVGALAVFQLDAPQVVRGLWLAFLGLLIAGRYPGGTPPAWETGRAEPWPSQQQLRERRDAMRAEHAPAAEPAAEETPASKAHPQSKKKKKKRR